MLANRRLAFIGAGNMAEAMLSGLQQSGQLEKGNVTAADPLPARRERIAEAYSVSVTTSNRQAAEGADILVLAVEPQILDEVLAEIAPAVGPAQLVISVAAGYPIARIVRHLRGATRVVRAMPNTPSMIRMGVTALAFDSGVSEEDAATARAVFEPIGQVVVVAECHMDVVTGLSGSGSAYVYVMIEALADGGVKMGLPREIAQLLAAQTMVGAARLVVDSDVHPAMLKDRVASPGGTTIAGLQALEQGHFRATLMSAVEAASMRSRELGLAS